MIMNNTCYNGQNRFKISHRHSKIKNSVLTSRYLAYPAKKNAKMLQNVNKNYSYISISNTVLEIIQSYKYIRVSIFAYSQFNPEEIMNK